MLQSIDTAIAFVLIMTVASVFVTIIVQMCSAALSLRGKNLANALALTFQKLEPALRGEAHELAAKILSDPMLSDSTRTEKDMRFAPTGGMRHKPWHFTDVRCAVRLASAIRPEEVFVSLKRLATSADRHAVEGGALRGPDERVALAAAKILDALVVPEEEAAEIKARLSAFAEIADAMTDPATKQQLVGLIENTPANLLVRVDAAREKFDLWFRSAQDRAQQWFQLHTRGLTIAASALIALLLQLDAVEIFHFVSTNSAARAALVGTAGRVIGEADGVLDEKGGLLKRIAEAWANLKGIAPVSLAGIVHVGQLQERLAASDPNFDANAFEQVVKATTTAYYKDQRDKLSDLTREVSATGYDLIPSGYWRWPSPTGRRGSLGNVFSHLPGIAICAALLSLGAPYWYNILKNLTSLRPALAQVIGKDQDRAGSAPEAGNSTN